jgi:hypothetical protein
MLVCFCYYKKSEIVQLYKRKFLFLLTVLEVLLHDQLTLLPLARQHIMLEAPGEANYSPHGGWEAKRHEETRAPQSPLQPCPQ